MENGWMESKAPGRWGKEMESANHPTATSIMEFSHLVSNSTGRRRSSGAVEDWRMEAELN